VIDRPQLDRWMAAAADGDRAAIAPLFHALWPILVGYATRLLGDRSAAEDCAQDALVQLFGQLERYDRARDALTWALALATWRCRTDRRRRTRRRELDDRAHGAHGAHGGGPPPRRQSRRDPHPPRFGFADPPELPAAAGALDGASQLEHRDLVRAALATLETLGARDIEAITIAVTGGDAPAIAPATFRKRLERALARLRTSWRSRHGTL
jgi:RNA polymerase sigma-70 factor (ECF subfamily)